MKPIKKGEEIKASFLNKLVAGVKANTPKTGNGLLVGGNGSSGFTLKAVEGTQKPQEGASEVPFRPFFTYTEGAISCSIVASQVVLDGFNIIPTFEGAPIYDLANADLEPPIKELDDESYEMWLELTDSKAKITVDLEAPEQVEGKAYYKLGEFVILDSEVSSIYMHSETGLPFHKLLLPWVPRFFEDDNGDPKFKINKGEVLDVMQGTYTPPELEEEYTPEADDEYYCKVTTSPSGSITAATVEKATSPTNTQHSVVDSTNGEYYYKLFTIKGSELEGFYVEQTAASCIHWHTRDLKNVGGETEIVNMFNPAENANEIKSLKGMEGEEVPEDWQEAISEVVLTDTGSTIEIQVNTSAPPPYEPDGLSAYMTLTKAGNTVANLTWVNGLLTGMDDGFGAQPALVVEICCETSLPTGGG